MGGRFGKYGDAKRKAQIRKNRLRPPVPQQRRKDKPLKGSRKSIVAKREEMYKDISLSSPMNRML